MPRTLYGYILRELLKLLVASTVVLVVLLSVGFSIKPISEGLLGPWQLLNVIAYTMPGMLAFALPFAAAFAGTMVFFRMSADNEITACCAGGVSYRGLLAPVVGLGLALTLSTFFLSNFVVPRFWRLVAEQIEQDVASMMVRQLAKGETVQLGRLIVYADRARDDVPFEAVASGGATQYDRLVLDGVAVGKLADRRNVLQADYTAERAVVDLYRDTNRERIYATMMLTNVTVNDPETGTLGTTERQPVEAQEIPSPFKQEPKFLSLGELDELAAHPQQSPDVRDAMRSLSEALAQRRLLERMREQLRGPEGPGGGVLRLQGSRGERYAIEAPRVRLVGNRALRLSAVGAERIQVVERAGGETTQRITAESGRLEVEADTLAKEPRINLVLESAAVFEPSLPAPSRLRELALPLLRWDEPVLGPLRAAPVAELVEAARDYPDSRIANRSRHLRSVVVGLVREIRSQLHERAATAVNVVLVLLLGAVMSMWLRRQVPLAIFFFCFIPTVAAFLTISSGQNMMQWQGLPLGLGIAMAWSGNAALAAIVLGVYLRLRRN